MTLDKVAHDLFTGATMKQQAKALMKMINFVVQGLDESTALIPTLRKLGVRHLIYGVEKPSYQAMAATIPKALSQVLGPDQVSTETKEAWYVLFMNMGQIMLDEYPTARKGSKRPLWKKTKGKWVLYQCHMTHDRMAFFRNVTSRAKEELFFNFMDSIDVVSQDDMSADGRPTEFGFMVALNGIDVHFGTESKEANKTWVSELSQRIGSYLRVGRAVIEDTGTSSTVKEGEKAFRAKVSKSKRSKIAY